MNNNNSPAAGIIPYIKTSDNRVQFLLGFETKINKWSGFVGGYEDSDTDIVNTAIREFNEETAKIFQNDLVLIKNKIISGDSLLITDSTKNRMVYLWFIRFPILSGIPELFLHNSSLMSDEHYKEKSEIKWFKISDIRKSKDILYKLKSSILNNYLLLV